MIPEWVSRLSEAGALSPLSTILAASLAAVAALSIAFLAYPWQKRKDRELQVNLEKRAAYARFFQASNRFYDAMTAIDEDKIESASLNLREALNGIFLYASRDLLQECKAIIINYLLFHALRSGQKISPKSDYKDNIQKLRNSYLHHETTALALARSEVLGIDLQASYDDVVIDEEVGYVRNLE